MKLPLLRYITSARGFAILLVLLNHLEMPLSQWGFIGVDLFFVISGFVLTRLVLAEINFYRARVRPVRYFSISNFYLNRLKRIFPPLIFMLLSVIVISQIYSGRGMKNQVLVDSIWTFFSLGNINFILQSSDYFYWSQSQSPLLHTWSLGVEEQYYLIFPLLTVLAMSRELYFIKKIRFLKSTNSRFAAFQVVIVGFSLFIFISGSLNSPITTFYSTPARAWELSSGSLIYLLLEAKKSTKLTRRKFSWFISSLWMTLVISMILIPENLNRGFITIWFVGIFSLIVYYSGLKNKFGNQLKSKKTLPSPMHWLGVRSYSIYLWHWPIIVMFWSPDKGRLSANLLLLVFVIFLFSEISFKFVETPFRRVKVARPAPSDLHYSKYFFFDRPSRIFVLLISSFVLLSVITYPKHYSGALSILTPSYKKIKVEFQKPPTGIRESNDLTSSSTQTLSPVDSVTSKGSAKPAPSPINKDTIWINLISESLQKSKLPTELYSVIRDLDRVKLKLWSGACASPQVGDELCNTLGDLNSEYTAVVMGDSYGQMIMPMVTKAFSQATGWRVKPLFRGQCMYAQVDVVKNGRVDERCNDFRSAVNAYLEESRPNVLILHSYNGPEIIGGKAAFEKGLVRQLEFATSAVKDVIIVGSTPGSGNLNNCVKFDGTIQNCLGSEKHLSEYRSLEKAYAAKLGAHYFDLTPYLCSTGKCPPFIGSVPAYLDGSHLTPTMAELMSPFFHDFLIKKRILQIT